MIVEKTPPKTISCALWHEIVGENVSADATDIRLIVSSAARSIPPKPMSCVLHSTAEIVWHMMVRRIVFVAVFDVNTDLMKVANMRRKASTP